MRRPRRCDLLCQIKLAHDIQGGRLGGDGLPSRRHCPTPSRVGGAQGLPGAEPVLHVGNLDAKRDFLDVRDVVAAYVEAMASERLESGAILNIASGEARRVGDVLESLLKKAKVPIRTVADPARFRPVDIQATVGDARLARALLDWAPKIPFEQTLTDMLDAQRAKSVS